jgi:THO complex subunit 2 N-terminus
VVGTEHADTLIIVPLLPPLQYAAAHTHTHAFQGASLVLNTVTFTNKLRKLNTDLVYRQQKFNLQNEETEGYAKVQELLRRGADEPAAAAAGVQSQVFSLVGFFQLDPNKCLDLLLDALELRPSSALLLELLRGYRQRHVADIFGIKFQHYRRASVREPLVRRRARRIAEQRQCAVADAAVQAAAQQVTARSLYVLLAKLVVEGVVSLSAVLAYMTPTLDALQQEQKAFDDAMDKVSTRSSCLLFYTCS